MEVVAYLIWLLSFFKQIGWQVVGNQQSNIQIQAIGIIVVWIMLFMAWMGLSISSNKVNWIEDWSDFRTTPTVPSLFTCGHFGSYLMKAHRPKIDN